MTTSRTADVTSAMSSTSGRSFTDKETLEIRKNFVSYKEIIAMHHNTKSFGVVCFVCVKGITSLSVIALCSTKECPIFHD